MQMIQSIPFEKLMLEDSGIPYQYVFKINYLSGGYELTDMDTAVYIHEDTVQYRFVVCADSEVFLPLLDWYYMIPS